ncbi:MAG: sodium:proton antiporter [Firmicutes bacterium HGW-Firmicutes-8]|nr:MAG: sodium:proton antiporter [Firmicutes bacterium HGW-Firmicutes-8]
MHLINIIREGISESLLIQLAIIIGAVKLAGTLSDKLNQPTVFGKLLIGIIIGPSVLGLIHETDTIKLLAELGVIMLMFLAGLETDVNEFKKAGFAATLTAIGGVILPMAFGAWYSLSAGYKGFIPLFIGTLLTATSVSISAQTLRELGRLRSKVGMTILGAAVIDDVLGIVVLTLVLGLAGTAGGGGPAEVTFVIIKMGLFFVFATYLGKLVIPPVLKWLHRMPVTQGLTAAALIFVFIFAFTAEKAGVANITGAYIAGIIMGTTKYRDEIMEKSEALGYSFLIPIFFVSIGLKAKVESVGGGLMFIVILSLIAVLSKLVGCGAGAKLSGFGWKKSLVIGTGMISRGEIALIIASIGLNAKLIDNSLYTALVIMILVSTIVTPPLLKAVIHLSDKKVKHVS